MPNPRSDEHELDDKVKKFATRQPRAKSFHETPGPDLEPDEASTPKSAPKSDAGDLPRALQDVADLLMENHDKPATLGHIAYAFNRVARQLTREPQ